jgi:glutamine cyclotransferase
MAPVSGYRVVKSYPHDRGAFTEGIFYLDGVLYESTGPTGHSSVRKVELATGRVLQMMPNAPQIFGEGLVAFGSKLIQLTYRDGIAFVYDRATMRVEKQFTYTGEGWGLTTDGKRLIMTDGSHNLRFFDPTTFKETGKIAVTDGGQPVEQLNELEYIKGEVWANVWQTDRIARINPTTGRVTGWIDLSNILSVMERRGIDVLNGIAYDAKGDRVFVTGKYWPRLFEIQLAPKR